MGSSKEFCRDCKKPSFGKSLCPECMNKQKERTKKRRQKLIEQGLCRECGKPAGEEHIYCEACRKKVTEGIQKIRKARADIGLCEICGNAAIYKSNQCKTCYERKRKRNQEYKEIKRFKGICLNCKNPTDETFSPYCYECREKLYGHRKNVYWERRQQGLCVTCGDKAVYDEENKKFLSRCAKCLEKSSDYKVSVRKGLFFRQRRPSLTQKVAAIIGNRCRYCGEPITRAERVTCGHPICKKKHHQKISNRVYQKRKAQGLCIECGNAPATRGLRCPGCADKNKNRAFRHVEQRKAQGLCTVCGNKPATQGLLCDRCTERNREKASLYQNKKKSQGLCITCGKVPATEGVRCPECAERNRRNALQYLRRKKARKGNDL